LHSLFSFFTSSSCIRMSTEGSSVTV
jgi:hypothetical protein